MKNTLCSASTQNCGSRSERSLAFDLERAQRAAYYAANYLRDHPGYTEAQEGYQAANARVEEIVAAMRDEDQKGTR